MTISRLSKGVLLAAACCAMTACAPTASRRADLAEASNAAKLASLRQQAAPVRIAATSREDRPYYGSKSVPFKLQAEMPAKFRERYEFRFPLLSFTLPQVIEKLTSITDIPIRLSQDAVVAGEPLKVVQLNMSATPEAVLDQICRVTGLNWELRDGVVVIQRLQTRTFTLMVQPGTADFDFSLGKSGQSQAGGSGGAISTGFTSQAKVGKVAKMTPMVSTVEAINKVLSKDGRVVGSEATGSIMVIDTPDGVERAARIVERENEVLTRTATFHVEVISFRSRDEDQAGIDWQVAFSNLNKLGATLTAPKSLTSDLAGNITLQLLGSGGGRFDGSKAFINLLNEYGKTSTVYKNDIRTRNRSTTTVQSLAQTVYIARTTPAPAAIGGTAGGTPGLEPGIVTAGVDLKMQPHIFDSNQISLLFNLGVVDLSDIVPLSSGEGANRTTIEGPETRGFEFQEETFLTPGVTTLITGYERVLESYTRRKLGRDVPLLAGGSFKGESQKEQLFILITPTIVGSAY